MVGNSDEFVVVVEHLLQFVIKFDFIANTTINKYRFFNLHLSFFSFSMESNCRHLQIAHIHFAFDYFGVFHCATCANNFLFWSFVLNVMAMTRKHKIDNM